MRFSIVSGALCGTAVVSALTLPRSMAARQETVDLSEFNKFESISIDKAKADAADDSAVTAVETDGGIGTDAGTGTGDMETMAGNCANPAVRVEWRNLADADKLSFVKATRCLIDLPPSGAFPDAKNRYEDLVVVHQQMTGSIHQVAQFLPWHRYYLHVFEDMLRTECSYTAPMPWWDEGMDSGNFANAPVFTSQYFGAAPAATNGQGTCVTDGAFGDIVLHVGGDRCLSRAVDESITINTNDDFVNTCNSRTTFSDMAGCLELGPHAHGHNGIGAVMSDVSRSPSDPIFMMHHTYVDHSWRIWQNADEAGRNYQVNGCSDGASPCAQLTADYVLTSMGLRPDTTVGAVTNTMDEYLCYRYDY